MAKGASKKKKKKGRTWYKSESGVATSWTTHDGRLATLSLESGPAPAASEKSARWKETGTGIVKRWRTRSGQAATLALDGPNPGPRRGQKPPIKKRKKVDLSDIPF